MPKPSEFLSQQQIVEKYGPNAPVRVKKDSEPTTLGLALQVEALACTAPAEDKEDPAKRAMFLARILHNAEVLLPEDLHMLGQSE